MRDRLTEGSLGLLGEHHRRTPVPLGLDGGAKSQVAGQAPASFKDVRRVVDAMTALDLIRPVVRLRPIAVLKG